MGGHARSRSSSRSRSTPANPTPAPIHPTAPIPPTQHHSVQVQQPGFFSNVVQGFGLGTGSAIAHNIFRSDPKPAAAPTSVEPPKRDPLFSKEAFLQCYEQEKKTYDSCTFFLPKKYDEFQQCMEPSKDYTGCRHLLQQ